MLFDLFMNHKQYTANQTPNGISGNYGIIRSSKLSALQV